MNQLSLNPANWIILSQGGATSTKPMTVTLITANGNETSELMEVPKSKGIVVETVEEFLKKCNIPKKRGKKKNENSWKWIGYILMHNMVILVKEV